ncbi:MULTISPECIES: dTDP-4-dehydrorhamnose reductase [unclassified Psychrobacter]|uniref:dTDP-4-dehydrorhamnose reductase n=1 Tax=unclassified Psychrobacter TaxID=196806 RepID=UPI0025B3D50F|nr:MULTISPECIES: dTDP-4-dehydrorhamnose reductase [unclassified Psychrobacter]MDN3454333.1 dTDP-4-dehydrorhamnose reductase [Psychrobacter sp. APC 3350]MDN3502456.1 dTDP-4-dehydrorhamnose reductase [Psychrobacter sp. 5A.1]
MKIVLLGKNGQVGWELQRALQPLGHIISLDRQMNDNGLCGDITNFAAIEQLYATIEPDIVINAAAYTAVDNAESDYEQADLINHLAVQNLAILSKQFNSLLVNYSSDYVFEGIRDMPWLETDSRMPINNYGQTKYDGEIALEQSGARFINFRTSWVYGTHGSNFIKTMLKLAQTKEELNIIADQIGAPTGAALIADITAQALRYYLLKKQSSSLLGHYNLAAQGECSWFDYAEFIFATAQKEMNTKLLVKRINPIPTSEYPTPAKRPLNSRLNTEKLQIHFKLHLPNWQQGVAQVLGELLS